MERGPDGLFEFASRRSPGKAILSAVSGAVRRAQERLAPFVGLSIAAHIALLGILAVAHGTLEGRRGPARPDASAKAARRALEAMRLDPQESRTLVEALAGLDDATYEYIFDHAPVLDPRLGEREQTEILRSLMRESLGRLGKNRGTGLTALDVPPWGLLPGVDLRGPVTTAAGDVLFPLGAEPDGRPRLYKIPAASVRRLESLRTSGDREAGGLESRGGKVEVRTDDGFDRVPGEYYYRKCPFERMVALGGSVFYAVSGFPRIEVPGSPARPSSGGRDDLLPGPRPAPSDAIKVIYMPATAARGSPALPEELPDLPPLSGENIPGILDGLMALGDGDQVRVFMERFLNGRDPDDPVLARLTQRFLYENLGSAFHVGDRLSTAFDFLEELFYNKVSQGELIAYGLKAPKSRAGAEILLGLASLYDFEKRGLAYLEDSLLEIEEVLAGRPGGRADVFDKPAKAFVLAEVHRDLVAGVRRRGLGGLDAALREYRAEQERIYRFLVESGGEVRDRARYALGVMYWDGADEGRALEEWRAIGLGFETPVLVELRWLKSRAYDENDLWNRIDRIFRLESQRNSAAALERLTRFHLWEKRSAKLRAETGG